MIKAQLRAKFIKSSIRIEDCPTGNLNEFAFIGRSNVGKSSLINMLTGQPDLAKTSSMPGKTRLINHFLVEEKWYLVDLPGYGYAKTAKVDREKFQKLIDQYIYKRTQLANLFVLIDSRIEPKKNDLDFINSLGEHQVPFTIIFTKVDKINREEVDLNIKAFNQKLEENWDELPRWFMTSAKNKNGREEIIEFINSIDNK